jgi:hypothetical protein
MPFWVYKVNSRRPAALTGWHFRTFFRYRGTKPYEMGGEGWIRSPMSRAHLRKVRKGDLFVCYQSDERRVYGLARTAGPGYEEDPGSGQFTSIDFEPGGLALRNPVAVNAPEHRVVFAHVRAFTVPSRGTIHPLAADEARAVLKQLMAANPDQRDALRAFLGKQK